MVASPSPVVVLINPPSGPTWEEGLQALQAAGATARTVRCETSADIPSLAEGATGLVLGSGLHLRVDATAFDRLPTLRFVQTLSIGFDRVDVDAATAHGVSVHNVPDFCVEEVSDQVMAYLLVWARRIIAMREALHRGEWHRREEMRQLPRLAGQTLGLLGFGRIARRVAEKARPFGLRILAHDPYVPAAAGPALGADLVALEDLLARSDYLSIHVPLNAETYHLLDGRSLRAMKSGAFLINTSRGAVVDEEALVQALQQGPLAGAALDVFEQEPLPMDHPLLRLPNVILTPHTGGHSRDSFLEVQRKGMEEVLRLVRGEMPRYCVNPEVLGRAR